TRKAKSVCCLKFNIFAIGGFFVLSAQIGSVHVECKLRLEVVFMPEKWDAKLFRELKQQTS
ncbi:MAG: hypothetical protein RR640_03540, partial [Oscillospiraceae bacterium]